ncbi:hypothetical protein [Flavobacterium sp.]|uniref:hypothetical protein n=1 Tax=Flavobacterium sp. TaxID=239 RepID=UPI00286BAE9B|nr:hypothetical protein [Flavobacterium sp.]
MKNIKVILLSIFCASLIVSCENDDDKFTGSPVGNLDIETITGTVSTDATFALPGQVINFTATLPQEFRNIVTDTVTVQASIFTPGGGLRNASVDILPGSNTGTGEISIAGGDGTFDLTFDLKLTAINLKKVVPGKHYLLNSNTVTVASGNSGVPSENDKRLKVLVDWENKTTVNKLSVRMERVGLTNVTLSGGSEGYANIKIGASTYLASFHNDYETTASDFVATHAAAISANNNVDVTAVGSDLHFAYTTPTAPVITITTRPGLTATVTAVDVVNGQATYTANNSFDLGNTVRVSNAFTGTNSVYNLPTGGKIIAISPTSFTVALSGVADGSATAVGANNATILTGTHLKGTVYAEVIVGSLNDIPKTYFFSATKLGTTSEGVATATASSPYAYTPGNYRLKIGVLQPTHLATPSVDLKYRIVLRYPDKRIEIYNGTYFGLTATSGFKSVLQLTKNGVGDATTYTNVVFTP